MPDVREKKSSWSSMLCRGLVFVSVVAFLALFVFSSFSYLRQLYFIQNTDTLVDSAITKVIGDSYGNDRCPTRQEVVLILSDVFYGLRQSKFKKPKNQSDTIAQALRMEILTGDGGNFRLEDPATKQESLVFIGRGLSINADVGEGTWPVFSNNVLFDNWARVQIEGLVAQRYLSPSDINKLNDLRETITVPELEELLDRIVEAKTQDMGYLNYVQSLAEKNPVKSAITVVMSVTANIVTLLGYGEDRRKETEF